MTVETTIGSRPKKMCGEKAWPAMRFPSLSRRGAGLGKAWTLVKTRVRRSYSGATTSGMDFDSPHDRARDRKQEDAVSQTRFINPDALQKPPGYTHVVEATAPAR